MTTLKFKDVQSDGEDYLLSLSKITGKKIKDIKGYVSAEYGEDTLVFRLCEIVMQDDSILGCEGEHDMPYIPCGDIDEEIMESIYKSDPDNLESES